MEVRTSDLYAAAYYLERGCKLEAVESVKLENGKVDRVFVITSEGAELVWLMARWSRGQAEVNLTAFRAAYAQVFSYVHPRKNKKRFDNRGEL